MDNDDATLIIPSSPPNDNSNNNNATENCSVGQIDDARRSGARVMAEAGGGPGLAQFRQKLLRAAQEEPSRTVVAAAEAVVAGA